ncbi:OmpA family protein [Glaciecola sp. 2405UD65-10]|uniref:OmpA family protein n=1 Tax=Glaciecola sp. 2405UD65-10 TaxID=3397244 RepID=UPI003B5A8D0C
MKESKASQPNQPDSKLAQSELERIRSIINAQAFQKEAKRHDENARDYVSKVFTEALHDRQQKDQSLSKVLVPIVEKSVQKSISQNRAQFIDSLYPLVGDLVRKYTTALLRDFIEKTNELIEKSVTFKSMAWRFKAWRAGVSYSRYLASQTYLFQIQQVLLIHRETGMLLNSASISTLNDENSDLVSSMLTAINDFVSDSFSSQTSGEYLDEIKTDNFTLYLRKGPSAYLVAAVTGNISPKAKHKLQATLENIHSLYSKELKAYQGDNSIFDPAHSELSECLIAEEKQPTKQKKPILATLFMLLLLSAAAYWVFLNWQTNSAIKRIETLGTQQGIVLLNAKHSAVHNIDVSVLRDPHAMPTNDWLALAKVNHEWLNITEIPYVSLAPNVINERIIRAIAPFSDINLNQANNTISGSINTSEYYSLLEQLNKIPGINNYSLEFNVLGSLNEASSEALNQAINVLAAEIGQLQLTFSVASAQIEPSHLKQLSQVAEKAKLLQQYANQRNQKAVLLVIGTSDQVGNAQVNDTLSFQRAENTKQVLISAGLGENDVLASGHGNINVEQQNVNVRKALITVIYNNL